MAKYYSVNLVLEKKKCVVAGAGIVAQRKVKRLLECGAQVFVISPEITADLRKLAESGKIVFKKGSAGLKDLKGAYLVIAATSDRKLNSSISSYCRRKNILINVVDFPKECNFILPSIVRRGGLTVSISTDGISPALAKSIRRDLEKKFGPEYAKLLRIMKYIRPLAIKGIKNLQARKNLFQKIFQPEILNLLKENKEKQAINKIKMYINQIVLTR